MSFIFRTLFFILTVFSFFYCIQLKAQRDENIDTLKAKAIKTAQNGNGELYYKISEIYRLGRVDLKQNTDSSAFYLEKASDTGYPDAQFLIGLAFLRGIERKKNEIKGLDLLFKAADKHNRSAMEILTKYFSDSNEVNRPKDIPKDMLPRIAFIQAKNSAELGSIQGAEYLGNAYRKGLGCIQNDTLAVVWIKAAALKGKASAQLTLANWYFNGDNPSLKCDLGKAHKYYTMLSKNRFADIDQQTEGRIGVFYTEQMLRMVVNMHYLLPLSAMTQAPQLRVRQ